MEDEQLHDCKVGIMIWSLTRANFLPPKDDVDEQEFLKSSKEVHISIDPGMKTKRGYAKRYNAREGTKHENKMHISSLMRTST